MVPGLVRDNKKWGVDEVKGKDRVPVNTSDDDEISKYAPFE